MGRKGCWFYPEDPFFPHVSKEFAEQRRRLPIRQALGRSRGCPSFSNSPLTLTPNECQKIMIMLLAHQRHSVPGSHPPIVTFGGPKHPLGAYAHGVMAQNKGNVVRGGTNVAVRPYPKISRVMQYYVASNEIFAVKSLFSIMQGVAYRRDSKKIQSRSCKKNSHLTSI